MKKGFINGGFFVFNRKLFNYLEDKEDCDLEFGALQKIAKTGEMRAFKHNDFWQCMDNIRERDHLESLIISGDAPWMVW